MKAPAAARSLDTVKILIGMTSVEVAIFPATAEDERITSTYSLAGNPVGMKQYDKVTEELLTKEEVITMVGTEAGPVYVDPTEVEAGLDLIPKTLRITAFYPTTRKAEFVVKSHRVVEPAPSKVKSKGKYTNVDNLTTQQQFSALMIAMAERGVMGFGTLVSRGRSYPILLQSDGSMQVVHFEQNVREARESKMVDPPADLLDEARSSVERLVAYGQPDLNDYRTERTLALANAKAPTLTLVPAHEPVPDLMQALKDSVAAAHQRKADRTG
jgi:non-homologous end joining protein Ku